MSSQVTKMSMMYEYYCVEMRFLIMSINKKVNSAPRLYRSALRFGLLITGELIYEDKCSVD